MQYRFLVEENSYTKVVVQFQRNEGQGDAFFQERKSFRHHIEKFCINYLRIFIFVGLFVYLFIFFFSSLFSLLNILLLKFLLKILKLLLILRYVSFLIRMINLKNRKIRG